MAMWQKDLGNKYKGVDNVGARGASAPPTFFWKNLLSVGETHCWVDRFTMSCAGEWSKNLMPLSLIFDKV